MTQKVYLYTQSLNAYQKALSIRGSDLTKKNYDFVASQLTKAKKELLQQQQKEQQQQQKKQKSEDKGSTEDKKGNSTQKNSSSQENKSGEKKKTDGQTWANTGHFQPVAKGGEGQKPLSEDQKSQLEGYLQYLKETQKRQGDYISPDGKPTQGGLFGDFFEENPFFSQTENSGDKPDW